MTIRDFGFDATAAALMDGWERRLQETFIAPPKIDEDSELPATGDSSSPPPRANIVVSRSPVASEKTVREACEAFLKQTAAVIPSLQVKSEPEPFAFRDKVDGMAVLVEFVPMPGVTLQQLHLFRIDAQVLTQLVATWASPQSGEWPEKLIDLAAGLTIGSKG